MFALGLFIAHLSVIHHSGYGLGMSLAHFLWLHLFLLGSTCHPSRLVFQARRLLWQMDVSFYSIASLLIKIVISSPFHVFVVGATKCPSVRANLPVAGSGDWKIVALLFEPQATVAAQREPKLADAANETTLDDRHRRFVSGQSKPPSLKRNFANPQTPAQTVGIAPM
ncbi:MAG: hypothetical protein H6656_10230 [Ardenticatenaceae bacterium]|nr:hypothetical protein [Ardenticatenaceae bacterium]